MRNLLFLSLFLLTFSSCKKKEPKSSLKEIIGQPTVMGVTNFSVNYDASLFTYSYIVPFGTTITNLTFTINISPLSSISPNPSIPRDYSNPVTYIITAEDGSTQSYTIKFNILEAPKSSEKQITEFKFSSISEPSTAVIDQTNKKITATLPLTANITKLIPTISVSSKATVSPASGEIQDFTKPIIYTVKAEDGTTQVYEVTITTTIPVNGLIAYYPFDGTSIDYSGNKNDGQAIGNPIFTTDRNGKNNGAISFNGKNQYVIVPDAASLKNLSTGVSVTAWVKINDWYLDWGPIVCKSSGQERHFQLAILNQNGQGKNYFLHSDGILPGIEIGQTVQFGTWYHVTMTVDGLNRTFYFNGVKRGSVNNYPQISPNSVPLYIGRDPYLQDEYLNGALDELTIYNRLLTDAEVKRIYEAEKK